MKIAIFHQFMDNIGGAEILVLHMARGLNADIYTTNIDEDKIKKMGFIDILPRIKSIGKLPRQAPFKQQLALMYFRKLNLGNKYDKYIIGGDWAISAAINHKPNIWYIHSPLNELWQFKDFIRNEMLSWWKKPIFDIWVIFNRYLTKKYSKHINTLICNSNNVKNRVKKYYNKECKVINPPVDTKSYTSNTGKGYWLSVNRLLTHKRVDMQIKAFAKMPDKKLIIVGSYEKNVNQFEEYVKYIESIKTNNIEILNWVDDKKLKDLYSNCDGFITTSRDEDFGMTVIEAMASGKFCIAPDEGGYKESIVNNKTGILIDDIDENKIINIIKSIKDLDKYKYDCINRSKEFDIDKFINKIKSNL